MFPPLVRKTFFNLIVVSVSLLICIFLLEGLIRFFHFVPHADFRKITIEGVKTHFRPNSSLLVKKPEYQVEYKMNNAGFRDNKTFYKKKDKGTIRLAFLGDSFTFGVGVPTNKRTSELVEKILNQKSSEHNFEIYNFGIPASNTLKQINIFTKEIAPYQPDYVFILFYIGNDLRDNLPRVEQPHKTGIMYFIRNNFQLYHFLLYRLANVSFFKKLYHRLKITRVYGEIYALLSFYDKENKNDSKLWNPTYNLLNQLIESIRLHKSKPVIVLVPEKIQYDDRNWGALLKANKLKPLQYDRAIPNFLLSSFIIYKMKSPVINPLPYLRQASKKGKQLFYPIDGHLNKEGHRLLAKIISREFLGVLER